MKANDNKPAEVILPVPEPTAVSARDIEIYARFMRHLRHVPNSRMEIKVLASIQFTADMLDFTDAQVAKTLVDLGLRAPRAALPEDFLNHADCSLMRSCWEPGAADPSLRALEAHWRRLGEERLTGFERFFPDLVPESFVPA
jgi:hypothetical protein